MSQSRIIRAPVPAGIAARAGLGAADTRQRDAVTGGRGRVFVGSVPISTGIRGRVVVIGGGMAGAAVARYLRLHGGSGVAVTLIERDAAYVSNVMSNRVLSGERTLDSLQCSYAALASRYGVKIVRGDVVGIDPVARAVTLASGCRLVWDRLVVAPGVDFDVLPGLESAMAQARVPHAWKAGPQTTALRNMITTMPQGGIFVLGIPAGPCRYPAGAIERACIVGDWLGRHRPGARVVVLDGRPQDAAGGPALAGDRGCAIEVHHGVSIDLVDASTMTVHTSVGSIRGDVLNLIPPQRAGRVIAASGLADADGRWTRVDPRSLETRAAPGVHVIGDAAAGNAVKDGAGASEQAEACADAVLRLLSGRAPEPLPQHRGEAPTVLAGRPAFGEVPANDGSAPIKRRGAAVSALPPPHRKACREADHAGRNALMAEFFA